MKRFLPLALALLSSCSLRQYSLVVVDPIPLYGEGGIAMAPVEEAPPQDTITVLAKNRKRVSNKTKVYYRSHSYWATGISHKTKLLVRRRLSRRVYKRSYALYTFSDAPPGRSTGNSHRISTTKPYGSTPSTGATIYTGPRGGRYYINSKGNKVYVKSGTSSSTRSSTRRSSSSSHRKSSSSSYRKSSGSSYRKSSGNSYRRSSGSSYRRK